MKNLRWIVILVGVMLAVTLFVRSWAKAAPEEVIKLKYASLYTLPHTQANAAQAWIEYIHRQTKGRVQITAYWGGSLISGKEPLAEIAAGVADIGYANIYTKKSYEIYHSMSLLMFASPSPEVSNRVSREIFRQFPQYQQEFGNVLVLGFGNSEDMNIFTNKPVRNLEDLKGMTICMHMTYNPLFAEFGAVGTMLPPSDIYIASQKGILGGIILALESLKTLRLAEVIKYITYLRVAMAAGPCNLMNLNSFNRLPKDIQKIFVDSQGFWADEVLKEFRKQRQAGIEFAKGMGCEFIELPADDLKRLRDTQKAFALKAAKDLDALGKPGSKILEEVLRLIDKYSK